MDGIGRTKQPMNFERNIAVKVFTIEELLNSYNNCTIVFIASSISRRVNLIIFVIYDKAIAF